MQQRNPSALTEWHAQAFGLQLQLHDVICQNIVQILIGKFLKIQLLCKIHENIHTKAEWTLWNHLACVTRSRRTSSQAAMFDYKKYPTRNDLSSWSGSSTRANRWLYELSVDVSRSHSGLSARWNWNKFCYAVVRMRSSAQEEDNTIEHAQCCPGKNSENIHRF